MAEKTGRRRGYWSAVVGFALTLAGAAVVIWQVITVGGVSSIPSNPTTFAGAGVLVAGIALAFVGFDRDLPRHAD